MRHRVKTGQRRDRGFELRQRLAADSANSFAAVPIERRRWHLLWRARPETAWARSEMPASRALTTILSATACSRESVASYPNAIFGEPGNLRPFGAGCGNVNSGGKQESRAARPFGQQPPGRLALLLQDEIYDGGPVDGARKRFACVRFLCRGTSCEKRDSQ